MTLVKYRICEEKTMTSELAELISLDNLEKKFGGTLENKEKDFFPPSVI